MCRSPWYAKPSRFPGLPVLLAEDDATNRTLIAEMLQRMGASVHTVSDGAAAVEEIARDKYDIVLLDLNMPVMDGLEAVKVIRERLADVDTLAVLALTADPGWIDRSVLAAAGFNGYVLKPTTSAELHIGITKVLERLPGEAPVQVAAARSTSDITFDTAVLWQLGDDLGDPGLVRDAVGVYLEELPGRLVEIHRGYGEGSREAVRSAAHALKGASAMLGAQRLSAICAQMETDATDTLLADVTAEAEVVETQMRDFLVDATASTRGHCGVTYRATRVNRVSFVNGFGTYASTPASMHCSAAPGPVSAVIATMGISVRSSPATPPRIRRVASSPSSRGMRTSMRTTP